MLFKKSLLKHAIDQKTEGSRRHGTWGSASSQEFLKTQVS